MTDFKPTKQQLELIEAAQLRFKQSKEAPKCFSKRFVDKCNDQLGVSDVDEQSTLESSFKNLKP